MILSALRILIIGLLLFASFDGVDWSLARINSQKPSKTNPEEQETLRINTALVTLSVGVNDKKGRPMTNLKKESFEVFEAGLRTSKTNRTKADESRWSFPAGLAHSTI